MKRPLRILTWHIHGNYLYYLSQVPHEFYLPVKPGRPEGYGGRLPGFDWPDNVHDIPAAEVKATELDCILYQSHKNYLEDQYDILSEAQRRLPRIFLEHNPPRQHPTNTRHPVDDPEVLLVHVTHFNELMWDNGRTPTQVIEHGVMIPPGVHYTGERPRGLVVVNNMARRNRLTGADIFQQVRREVPLDLVGMDSETLGGLGEINHDELPALAARYRFFFNPIRYTSLGLAVCEAMMIGLPVIGLATTEMVTAVDNNVTGYVSTNIPWLIQRMKELIAHPLRAQRLSDTARYRARQRFGIERFSRDWDQTLRAVVGRETAVFPATTLPLSETTQAEMHG
ncbi:MAG: glycosyltransferase family 4 protein [Anaerolineaceae bacterium]|nr:glycosyltransferase family 4 protein [Anaerolineaceae bacterium]